MSKYPRFLLQHLIPTCLLLLAGIIAIDERLPPTRRAIIFAPTTSYRNNQIQLVHFCSSIVRKCDQCSVSRSRCVHVVLACFPTDPFVCPFDVIAPLSELVRKQVYPTCDYAIDGRWLCVRCVRSVRGWTYTPRPAVNIHRGLRNVCGQSNG